jgi:predicted phosphodiesterase
MKIAVFSDIHGNCLALETVLADIKQAGVDQLVCLGDVVQGGPQPAETLAIMQELVCPVVMGNTDDWMLTGTTAEAVTPLQKEIREWTVSQLSKTDLEFMTQFSPTVEIELSDNPNNNKKLLCFHGSPKSYDDHILPPMDDPELAELLGDDLSTRIYTGGHVHSQIVRRIGDTFYFRPGSVGRVYDRNRSEEEFRLDPRAEYALLTVTGDQLSLEFRQVPMNIEKLSRIWKATKRPDAEKEISFYKRES